MGAYHERLRVAADRVVELQDPEDGGWGASSGQRSSVVNTAEGLVVLRAAGLPYSAGPVRRAIEFLCEAITTHPVPGTEGGRGEWTRYVTYGLLGLTEYDDWGRDETSRNAIKAGVTWLRSHTCDGGWGARAGDTVMSLFHTAQALRALERLGVKGGLVTTARLQLRKAQLEGRAWPNSLASAEPSAPKTALAALALADGDEPDLAATRSAAEWLLDQRSAWQQTVHTDPDMEGVRWTHMTFALGAQACLAAGMSPSAALLVDTVRHLDSLWDRGRRMWREGPDRRLHPAGIIPSAAVVQTYEAFSAALARKDPTEVLPAAASPRDAEEFHLVLLPSQAVALRREDGEERSLPLGARGRFIIDQLVSSGTPGQLPGLSRHDLDTAYGYKAGSLDRAVRRINELARHKVGIDPLIEVTRTAFTLRVRQWEYAEESGGPIVIPSSSPQPNMRTHKVDGITFFTFNSLAKAEALVHGVFSRHGGVSSSPYASLNVSLAVGDHPENVRENVRRVASALGFTPAAVFSPRLVHKDGVYHLRSADDLPIHQHTEADAVITDVPGVLLLMHPADCAVVLLYDPGSSAIGMVHAGWKGLVAGLPAKTVARMKEAFGAEPGNLTAAIGPSVGPCHYRIVQPAQKSMREWAPYLEDLQDGSTAIDLPGMLIDQLLDAGIDGERLEVDRRCTACQADTFFSYWLEKPTTGRMAVGIGLLPQN